MDYVEKRRGRMTSRERKAGEGRGGGKLKMLHQNLGRVGEEAG